MRDRKDPSAGPDGLFGGYDEDSDTSQRAELLGPDDDGFYTSQLRDWIPLCPQLRDSAVRFYWILRALVIEKHGPVRKLTLLQMCYLLPSKQMQPGEAALPSSLARVRSLLSELSEVGLLSTPEGGPVKTSSRAGASAAPLRIRINDRPHRGYAGPRNAFALLDEVKRPAAEAARKAVQKERERSARKRALRTGVAGQISGPLDEAGQISSPRGQISSPRGQISSPLSGPDLQDRDLPFSPSAQTFRSEGGGTVRPSVQVEDAHVTDGRTAGSDSGGKARKRPAAPGEDTAPAAVASGSTDTGSALGGVGRVGVGHRETTPGMEVLTRVARVNDSLRLAGRVLLDQAGELDKLIAASEAAGEPWRLQDLVTVLSAPLDGPIRISAGAVISGRIRQLPLTPRTAMLPAQANGNSWTEKRADLTREPSSSLAADRPVDESVNRRLRPECPGCGVDSPGGVLCPGCLGWPLCEGGCGRRLEAGGTCEACHLAEHHRAIERERNEDGTCPGYDGLCGRPVLTLGLCGKCRIKAEATKAALDEQWATQVAAVTAMTDEERALAEAQMHDNARSL
ncbi:hypothetical protein [Streptomyces sp. NPDC056160]|uniref:hypothetical protein n=1 Tax=Streptomyces sp. NPDC056160 TaxID=3345731 RepID=UPI0035E0C7E5